jgi:DNA-binding transcriptional ArsR family regulator
MTRDALRLLGTARRQELLRLCWAEERSAGELHRALPDVTFGAISQHLRKLTEAGVLAMRKQGRHRFYRARREVLGPLRKSLEAMWGDALWRLKLLAELRQGRRGPHRRQRPQRRARSKERP